MSYNRDTKNTNDEWIIENFGKINTKEIDPIAVSNEREKILFENGFDIIVNEINDLIFKLSNKGTEVELERKQIIEYFNDHNINLREYYNLLFNNQNDFDSIFLLGYFNYFGIATDENSEKAFKLFIEASEKNHLLAQYYVGECYEDGFGIVKNEKVAFKYFKKLANKNYSMGQLRIDCLYDNGIGLCINLGLNYQDGIGVEKDFKKAFELFKQSAEGGSLTGINSLGCCYEVGITKDVDKAIYWYEKSAKQGDQDAKYKIEKLKSNNLQ
ncbi:kinase-like domain-containing protein [Rhizophagus clarus]|uniref:Kinase-like domain-containing protein n=1 Tax=Rhizophagus clarus TaxID=94130 RepID=A0A8H3R605_9GLOM|nr:kinase-like domain-containing protein [Rhizophagus clarus]